MKTQIVPRLTVALTFASACLTVAMIIVSMFCQPDDYCKSHGLLLDLVIFFCVLDIIAVFYNKEVKNLSCIELCLFCLVFAVTACHLAHRVPAGELRFMLIVMTVVVFFCIKPFCKASDSLYMTVFMTGLSLVTMWQVFYGLIQTMGLFDSNSDIFTCTGSFSNPGPFGGFLAMSAVGMAVWSRSKSGFFASIVRTGTIVAIIGIAVSGSRAAFLSIAVPAFVWLLFSPNFRNQVSSFRRARPFRIALYSFLAAIAISGSVIIIYKMKQGSADSRILMDKITIRAIATGGIAGSGLGSFPASYARAQTDYFSNGSYSERERLLADSPQKAFNELLEIGVEAGPITMILAAVLIIMSLVVLVPLRSPLGYMLLSVSIFSLFSYPLLFMQFRIPIALCVASAAEIQSNRKRSHTVRPVISILQFSTVFIGLLLIKGPLDKHIEASEEWHHYSSWYDSRMYKAVCDNYAGLYNQMKHHPVFLAQYGLSLAAIGEFDKSDSVLKAMTLVSSDPLSYNRMAENRLECGDYIKAENLFRKSFAMVPNRLVPLAGIARSLYAQGDMERFRLVADTISSFVPKVESGTTAGIREEIARLYIENR